MKQRIGVARALLQRPAVILIEEPLPGVLSGVFEQVDRQTTFVIVTAKPSAANFADRIVVLEGGTFVEIGTNEELKEHNDTNVELCSEMEPSLCSAATDQLAKELISKKQVSKSIEQYRVWYHIPLPLQNSISEAVYGSQVKWVNLRGLRTYKVHTTN